MATTPQLFKPELFRFETPDHILNGLDEYYDLLQSRARQDKLPFTGDTLERDSLKSDILQLAHEHGFSFLDDSHVGVLYYEPSATRKAHVDVKGETLIVTTSGQGTYLQYPHTDEYYDRACMEMPITPDEAEFQVGVAPGHALLANQSIAHSFHNGVFPRTAFYIVR